MALLYRGETRFDLKGAIPVKLPVLIRNYSQIIFRADCKQAKSSWKVAGQLTQVVFLPGIGRIFTEPVSIRFSENMVIDLKKYPLSQLVFSPVKWLNLRTNITITKSDTMLYAISGIQTAVSGTGTSSSVNCLATATSLVAANASRLSLIVQNLGTKTVFLGFTNAVTTSAYAIQLPAGAAYEFPVPFNGALWGISASGTQAINVVELS